MPTSLPPASPLRRALHLVVRGLRVAFVLLLVLIPVPVTALFAKVFRTRRDNEVTQVKKEE